MDPDARLGSAALSAHGQGSSIRAQGARMWIEREGTGEPVVIAGGGPGKGHAHYHPWFSALAERFEVVYFDYLGTGRSDRLANRGDYSIRRYADQIEAVRLCLGVQRIAVIGVSFGGMPALDYPQRHPGAVKRLVLSNAQISARTWQERNIDVVNEALRVHFPERWRTLTAMRDRGVRSLDDDYQELFAELLEHLEWTEAQRPQLEGDDFNAPNLEVYAGIVAATAASSGSNGSPDRRPLDQRARRRRQRPGLEPDGGHQRRRKPALGAGRHAPQLLEDTAGCRATRARCGRAAPRAAPRRVRAPSSIEHGIYPGESWIRPGNPRCRAARARSQYGDDGDEIEDSLAPDGRRHGGPTAPRGAVGAARRTGAPAASARAGGAARAARRHDGARRRRRAQRAVLRPRGR